MASDIQVTITKRMAINEIRIHFVRKVQIFFISPVRPHVSIRETLNKIRYTVRRNSKFVGLNF
jgi:hypothetical protein